MSPRQTCGHEKARFHSVQRLSGSEPVELWHCPTCKSTVSAGVVRAATKPVAAA